MRKKRFKWSGGANRIVYALYKDRVSGRLPDDVCFSLLSDYSTELDALKDTREKLKREIEVQDIAGTDTRKWVDGIRKYTNITTLNRYYARALIDKIVVSDQLKVDGQVRQQVSVIYRFVGDLKTLLDKGKGIV